jgi:tetratricopeptide (TPR) repeat protein
LDSDLSLFNKLGDLYLKTGDVQQAVETYDRAADMYEKAGLPNNAIALCNKILRNSPGRTQAYLKLAKLMLARGFIAEAKKNLLEYAARMQKAGALEDAFRALAEFADLSPDNEEIRLLLAEQLKAAARSDEAKEQLAQLYADVEASGDERRTRSTLQNIKAIDPDFDEESAPKAAAKAKPKKTDDLVFIDVDATDEPEAAPPPLGVETTALVETDEPVEEIPHEETEEIEIERASTELIAIRDDVDALEGLEGTSLETAAEEEAIEMPSLEIETTALDDTFEEPAAAAAVADEAAREAGPSTDLSIELEPLEAVAEAPPDIPTLEAQVAESPDDPALHRSLGEALLAQGDRERGLEELDAAVSAAEAKDDWRQAEDVAEEILRLDPNSVRHHQKRVEYAFRRDDEGRLVECYLSLADALFRQGAMDRSRAVYERVIELDPGNDAAQAALANLGPAEEAAEEAPAKAAAAETGGDFVDLGALILGDEAPVIKDTRMRIEEEEPTGDEDRDFAEMLAEFK